MADTSSLDSTLQPSAHASVSGDAGASDDVATKSEKVAPGTEAAKPRRRSPAKPRQSRAKSSAKTQKKASEGRFDRADGSDQAVMVDATELLSQVGQLTEQLARTRVALETATAERHAFAAELEQERDKRSHAERRAETNEAARAEADEKLSRERRATEVLEADVDNARREAEDVKHQLSLTWSQLQAADGPPAPADEGWRSRWRSR